QPADVHRVFARLDEQEHRVGHRHDLHVAAPLVACECYETTGRAHLSTRHLTRFSYSVAAALRDVSASACGRPAASGPDRATTSRVPPSGHGRCAAPLRVRAGRPAATCP